MNPRISQLTPLAALLLATPAFSVPVVTGFPGAKLAAVSADGSTVVGSDEGGTFRWTQAGGKVYVNVATPYGLSADGAYIAGTSEIAGGTKGFRWKTDGTVQVVNALGTQAPIPAYARVFAISGDGSTLVGICSSSTSSTQGFAWKNGVTTSLGDLAGGAISSRALAVSNDGSVIVGESNSALGREAFVKIGSAAMKGLGDFPGGSYVSSARGVTPDGSIVVGFGSATLSSGIFATFAFKANNTGGLVKMASPASDSSGTITNTQANAASNATILPNGPVIVGQAVSQSTAPNPDGTTATLTRNVAVVWTGTTGKRLVDLVVAAGGPKSAFETADGISADADVLIGNSTGGGWILSGARPLFGLSSNDPVLPKVSVSLSGAAAVVQFDTVEGQSYQVQRTTDLSTGDWSNVGEPYLQSGKPSGPHEVTDTTAISDKAFYRVTVQIGS